MKKIYYLPLVILILIAFSGCAVNVDLSSDGTVPTISLNVKEEKSDTGSDSTSNLIEYCLTSGEKLKMKAWNGTPLSFLSASSQAQAAINGVYYGADDDASQGVAYSAGTGDLGSGKGLISGYVTITNDGVIAASDVLEKPEEEYAFIIGTHPLLVQDAAVHPQAKLPRYNTGQSGDKRVSFRSALGTKDGAVPCFAVSKSFIGMEEWAQLLVGENYRQAINLDGGPVSQLAMRKGDDISVAGGGGASTRLILYAE